MHEKYNLFGDSAKMNSRCFVLEECRALQPSAIQALLAYKLNLNLFCLIKFKNIFKKLIVI